MALQDDINNLTKQINDEQQRAHVLEEQIMKEQQESAQKIDSWQQQIRQHYDQVERMQQDMQAKQQQLADKQRQQAEEAQQSTQKAQEIAKGISRGLF